MKRLLFIFALALIGFNAQAENKLTKVGYVGNVGISLSF